VNLSDDKEILMNKPVRILGIAGSLRRESYNRAALRAAAQLVPPDATLDIFELDGIPGFNQDEEQNPPAKVVELKRRIREADAVLFVTPEYNYSVPGVLKNAIDWASRPAGAGVLRNKPVAVIGASTGMFGAVWAQAELRKVLSATGARVTEVELAVGHAHEHLHPSGRPVDEAQQEALCDAVHVLLGELQPAQVAA
jgi:chromate reductase, NAD(P)H dehydrogenase (quinone)